MKLLKLLFVVTAIGGFIWTGSAVAAAHRGPMANVKASQNVVQQVNINTADAAALESLKGIGVRKAQAIVDYRNQHGKFKSLNDLTNVHGIGVKFLARLKQRNPDRLGL